MDIHTKVELWQAFLWPAMTLVLNVVFSVKPPEWWEERALAFQWVRIFCAGTGLDISDTLHRLKGAAEKKAEQAKNNTPQ